MLRVRRRRVGYLFLCQQFLRWAVEGAANAAWHGVPGTGAAAAATALLENNYRVEIEATIPSPLIDSHQVG